MEGLDWDKLAKLAFKGDMADNKRQQKYKDFDTTGSMCTSQVGLETGVSLPRKKPGTNGACVVKAMLALSAYIQGADFLWIPKGLRLFNCDDSQDPWNKFAHWFHKDCCIPAAKIGLTNLQNPCAYHVDEMNLSMIQYECVPTFARYVIIENIRYRCALIGYSQHLVDNCLIQAKVHGPYDVFHTKVKKM